MSAHGEVRVVEAEAQRALLGQRLDDAVEQVAAAPPLLVSLDLLGRALDVAEVGHEDARPVLARAHDGQSVGSGEPREVADVDHVGDEQRVEPAPGQALGEAVGALRAHRATSRCSRSAVSASR